MDNFSVEEIDFVEIIPIVKKYEWGKKEENALTKVFYRNLHEIKLLELNHFSSTLSRENGNTSNSSEFGSKEITETKKKETFSVDKKIGLLEANQQEDHEQPYAELWYGSHISSPSKVSFNGNILENMTLDDIISSIFSRKNSSFVSEYNQKNQNPNSLDLTINPTSVTTYTGKSTHHNKIPFLLKILSISKPLSLQVHPDKTLAKELHSSFPSIYSDDNHKPEIAIALSEFETLCGFKDTLEILSLLEGFPEILPIFGISLEFIFETINSYNGDKLPSTDQNQDPLFTIKKELFINMLNSKPETINDALSRLVARLTKNKSHLSSNSNTNTTTVASIESLILRLHYHFPLDIGIISPLLLNYYKLNPGDAIFIGAGTIHSYISGECLECMANSDNVIRCGLTPKLKDIPNLIKAVNFQSNNSKLILNHIAFSSLPILGGRDLPFIIDYFVDSIKEYHVQILSLDFQSSNSIAFSTPTTSPYSLLLCLSGNCTISFGKERTNNHSLSKVFQGKAIFVNFNTEIYFHPLSYDEKSSESKDDVKFALVTLPPPLSSL
ncbi:mannose-6-phosphate isomerase [Cryptosporidium ubiquitum]|uniref:mannose-6-phosphate isomerase n=1 Tax=Cryptosporidium ubiquitum TaxID=857276 RepID=A0A1J4MHB4_9CRYT|nr:mannose-6-phosphate isomerase [Cryptosporidium ubiquitum]OII73622.1 mannose-6-phosphate isomerase [Cryptosporidium ubiquitum]